jgi:hypothetical protein
VESVKVRAKKSDRKKDPFMVNQHRQETVNLEFLLETERKELERWEEKVRNKKNRIEKITLEEQITAKKTQSGLLLNKAVAMLSELYAERKDVEFVDFDADGNEFLSFVKDLTGKEVRIYSILIQLYTRKFIVACNYNYHLCSRFPRRIQFT